MTIISILILTSISSLVSIAGATLLAQKKNWPKKFLLQMTAFASGVLLATSLLHLGPEAIEQLKGQSVFYMMFFAIVVFFLLERLVLWHHHHHENADECSTPHPSAWFILFGDSLHNFIDGILIASAYMVDPKLGLITAFAVAAHEIPQEIADFSIMVAAGVSRKRALLYNAISAFTAVLGAVLAYYFLGNVEWVIPYVIAFSAGMFLYIALSDLVPELHSHNSAKSQKWYQLSLFFIGMLIIGTVTFFAPHAHVHEGELHLEEHDHSQEHTHDELHSEGHSDEHDSEHDHQEDHIE